MLRRPVESTQYLSIRYSDRLAEAGFEIYFLEDLSFAYQVRLFGEARSVIGLHGAGLANTVFCKAGTTVIELAPRSRAIACFETIAYHRGLHYSRLLLDSDPLDDALVSSGDIQRIMGEVLRNR